MGECFFWYRITKGRKTVDVLLKQTSGDKRQVFLPVARSIKALKVTLSNDSSQENQPLDLIRNRNSGPTKVGSEVSLH